MSKTRLKALLRQIESGKLKTDAARILQYIIENKYTSRPLISDALDMKLQTVVARVSDLLDLGIIEVVPTDQETDYEILTHVPDTIRQMDNAFERRKAKFNAWKKRGMKEFGDFLDLSQLELTFN